MHVTKGFSLLECMVYCAGMVTVITILCYFFTRMHGVYVKQYRFANYITWLYSVQEFIRADLEQAPIALSKWKKLMPSELIFTSGARDIGWTVKKGQLRRIIGHYDIQTQRWISKHSSLVIDKVTKVSFAPLKTEQEIVHGLEYRVECQYKNVSYTVEQVIVFKNGMILYEAH